MKIKLEHGNRILFLTINAKPTFGEEPGSWQYFPYTNREYGIDFNGKKYLSGWLYGKEAIDFFDLVERFYDEKRLLIGKANGIGRMEYKIDFESKEFH